MHDRSGILSDVPVGMEIVSADDPIYAQYCNFKVDRPSGKQRTNLYKKDSIPVSFHNGQILHSRAGGSADTSRSAYTLEGGVLLAVP